MDLWLRHMMIKWIVLLLAISYSTVSGLLCVECSSPKASDCSDPINSTTVARHQVTCERNQVCAKMTYTDEGESHVDRFCGELPKGDELGCGWEIRVDSRIGSGWACFCDDNLCNAAAGLGATGVLVLVAAAALAGAVH